MSINHYLEEVMGFPRDRNRALLTYVSGFALSLALTAAAYLAAAHHILSALPLVIVLLSLAGVQFIVQIVCFLHLDRASASRERLIALIAIMAIVLILVVGSLWIMSHLNARMMADPGAMQQYMDSQSGL